MVGLVHRLAFGNSVSNVFICFQGQSPEVISDGRKSDQILGSLDSHRAHREIRYGLVHWGGRSQFSLSAASGAWVPLVKWQCPRHLTLPAFSVPSLVCLETLQSIPSTFPSPN